MKVHYVLPYSLEKDLGKEYNYWMNLCPKDTDWMCFMDGDIMFLNFDWGHIIQEVVDQHPDAGIITCYTNRISRAKDQLYGEESKDILVHRLIAKDLDEKFRGAVRKTNSKISGFLMVIQKKTWKEIGGCPEKPGRVLDVDGIISKKILSRGLPIYLMRGLYVLHYYRMAEGKKYKAHLVSAETYLRNKKPKTKIGRGIRAAKRNARIIKKRRTRSLKT